MAVAADGDAGGGPVPPDTMHQAAKMAAELGAARRPAGPQQHRHRARGGGVVGVDRQEAALVVVGVEQRELLAAVHHVAGVVDVQRHRGRWSGVAGAVEVDHGMDQARHLAPARHVLPARHGRLRAGVGAAVRQPSAGQLEARIAAQLVEVVGVLVAAGDRQDARPQDVGRAVAHQQRMAPVGDQPSQPRREAKLPIGCRQQQHAAVRGEAAAVERRCQLLAANGWKTERQDRIVGHGECGSGRLRERDGVDTQCRRAGHGKSRP